MVIKDLGEFGIAPRSIHVTKEFREENKADSSRKRVFDELFGSAIPGIAPLKDFIVPVRWARVICTFVMSLQKFDSEINFNICFY